jgi:hypothetical protein
MLDVYSHCRGIEAILADRRADGKLASGLGSQRRGPRGFDGSEELHALDVATGEIL